MRAATAKRPPRRRRAASGDSDRLTALHDTLTDAVAALVSGEEWAAMLAAAARFHRYSLSNLLLIHRARPDATRVAGFRTWLALGRHVRKGERGIPIRALLSLPGSCDRATPSAAPRRRLRRATRRAAIPSESPRTLSPTPPSPRLRRNEVLDGRRRAGERAARDR